MRLSRSLPLAALACAASLAPAPAFAIAPDLYPYVQDGPIIVGVTSADAWVSWYTGHHEGAAGFDLCSTDGNTDTPTLTLSSNGAVLGQFTDPACERYHKVHLTGLLPATRYTFTLDKAWDSRTGPVAAGSFTTAPAPGSRAGFKFVVYGDTRNHVFVQGSDTRADHQAMVDAIVARETDAAFLLHTGDLALNVAAISGDDRGYTEFFAVERALLASRPLYVVLGNHETLDTGYFDAMFDPARFNGLAHPYYSSFDWGPVHVAMVDAFEGPYNPVTGNAASVGAAQVQWLDADLQHARATGQLSFVGVHQGPFSHAMTSTGHGGLADVAAKVVPLMLQHGALASLAGHDHYYQRGHEGCIDYLVVGGGGATQYAPDPAAPGVAFTKQTLSYLVVTVSADGTASGVVKDPTGAALDAFAFVAPPAACSDAGTDGGTGADAGSVDAGSPDAGSSDADAGNTSDAGNGNDAGNGPATDAGNGGQTAPTGCAGSGPATLQVAALTLLALLLRRRPRAGATRYE